MRRVIIAGEELGAFRVDLTRLKSIMVAVVQALHYRDHCQKWTQWLFFSPTIESETRVHRGRQDDWEPLRQLLSTAECKVIETSEPSVFTYATHQFDWAWLYKLTFYERFVAFLWMVPE